MIKVHFFGMPIKTLGSLGKIRVGRVTGNTHIFFFGLVLVTCKNEEDDPIKNEGPRVLTRLYFNCSDTQGQLTPRSVVESCRNSNSSKLL